MMRRVMETGGRQGIGYCQGIGCQEASAHRREATP